MVGEYIAETKDVFINKALAEVSDVYFASDLVIENYDSDLIGNYQFHNKKTAVQAIRVLQSLNAFSISEANIRNGLVKVVQNTGLLGRWQQLGENPKIICDTAHNKEGLSVVLKQVESENFKNLHIVLGVVDDKDLDEILPLFPKNALYYFCKPNIPRGLDAKELRRKARSYGILGNAFDSIATAYNEALLNAGSDDFIYVGGSTFVVAEIL